MQVIPLLTLLVPGQFSALPAKKPPTLIATPTPAPRVSTGRLLWKTAIKRGEATAALGDPGVFVAGGTTLFRLNPDGRLDWSTEIGATQSEVTLEGKRAYVGSDRGTVYALDQENGSVVWKCTQISGAVRMAPAVVANRVIVESNDNNVYGLDAATGALKWLFTRPDGSLGYSAPTPAPANTVVVCGESVVYRLDGATGKSLWNTTIGGKALGTPSVGGGRVFVAGDGGGLVSIDLESGNRRWRFRVENDKTGPDWFGSPLLVGKTLYVTTYRRNVYALDATTGRVKWSTKVLGPALARPALDPKRNVLYVTSGTFRDNPTLTALNARTGAKLWDYKLGYLTAAPALSGDRLYLGSTNGYFYAFSIQ